MKHTSTDEFKYPETYLDHLAPIICYLDPIMRPSLAPTPTIYYFPPFLRHPVCLRKIGLSIWATTTRFNFPLASWSASPDGVI